MDEVGTAENRMAKQRLVAYVLWRRGREEVVAEKLDADGNWEPLKHIVRHSPVGPDWGYEGSGPADLALSILTDAVGAELADAFYTDFMADVIAHLRAAGDAIPRDEIVAWFKWRGVEVS